MKKEILIIATVFTAVAFISCSKEKMGTMQLRSTDEITTASSSNSRTIDPLTVNLEGWFAFDNNLKDKTGKLPDGIASTRGIIYGTDRKGVAKGAIYFDSSYGVTLKLVPQQTHTSLSVWVKYASQMQGAISIIGAFDDGPKLAQAQNIFIGTVESQPNGASGGYSGLMNNSWHHVVVTYDGSILKMYVDNVVKVSMSWAGTITPRQVTYNLAHLWPTDFWKGYMDDLRFYSRTLSASDVSALYNQ